MPAPPSSSTKQSVDLTKLSLTQLQKLSQKGSRRAKAELERRMTSSRIDRKNPPSKFASERTQPASIDSLNSKLGQDNSIFSTSSSPAPDLGSNISSNTHTSSQIKKPTNPKISSGSNTPSPELLEKMQMINLQNSKSSNINQVAQLLGLVILAWGILVTLSSFILLGRSATGGAYYIFCGIAIAIIGFLLFKSKQIVLYIQPIFIIIFTGWAYAIDSKPSIISALIQAAPIIVPALWAASKSAREELE